MCTLCVPGLKTTASAVSHRLVRAPADEGTGQAALLLEKAGRPGVRVLLRGGIILSVDPEVGNFASGDVLIEGNRIAQIGPDLRVTDALVIDARGKIIMPGFIDTHHHLFETGLRSTLPDAIVVGDGAPEHARNYYEVMLLNYSQHYRPEDVYINSLYGGLAQLDAGVTTVMDVSQIHHSAAHSDAAIAALKDAGRRAVLGYFEGWWEGKEYPHGARRLRSTYFNSDDGILPMVMGVEIYIPGYEEA